MVNTRMSQRSKERERAKEVEVWSGLVTFVSHPRLCLIVRPWQDMAEVTESPDYPVLREAQENL